MFVKVQAIETLKKVMLSNTVRSKATPKAYVSHIPRLFITRVLGFTSLWATPTFMFARQLPAAHSLQDQPGDSHSPSSRQSTTAAWQDSSVFVNRKI
ncbi:hypothetical protein I79_015833 [Cricetulus griseus]|uniref:Uncharacterized protein n=1 Tax=Cricetulus griseus TaxID=10029 RepID=G3HXR9_CRIGR|nr:hypothetical protein I79_015833 [Cricetulus griseus]